jgi:hypothetical protein
MSMQLRRTLMHEHGDPLVQRLQQFSCGRESEKFVARVCPSFFVQLVG